MRLKLALMIRDSVLTVSVFAVPGTPSIKRVAFRQQRDQDLFDRVVLSDDYFAQFSANVFDSGGDGLRHSVC